MMQALRQTVDLSGVPVQERHPYLRTIFDALPAGGTFVLVQHEDPGPLLARLRADRRGVCEWWPLEEGPEAWRIEVRRRAGAAPCTVLEFLGADHDRLDGLMDRVRKLVAAGSLEEASHPFAEFRAGLRRHIRLEEAVLFPAFERATGLVDSGPTAVMRAEHHEIGGLLERMTKALAAPAGAPAEFERLRSALVGVLTAHNEKEEQVVYPITDRSLPPRERSDLIEKMMEA